MLDLWMRRGVLAAVSTALATAGWACGGDAASPGADTATDVGLDSADTATDGVTVDALDAASDLIGGCTTSAECRARAGAEGTLCLDGACVACEGSAQCAADADYGDGFYCLDGACAATVVACLSSNGCDAEPGFAGTRCVDGQCLPCDSRDACEADPVYAGDITDCVEGRCDLCPAGRIGCACDDEGACGDGFCIDDVCEACPDGRVGCPCLPEATCDEGVCIADTCVGCTVGDVACLCGAGGVCASGARCAANGVLCEVCPAGALGCPCAAGSCADGLDCVADQCAVHSCKAGEAGCPCRASGADACDEGLTCGIDASCHACTTDIAGCACDLTLGCSGGLVCDAGDEVCRAASTCATISCGEGRLCAEGDTDRDAVCLDACEGGYTWNPGAGACDLIVVANCGSAPGSIAAACVAANERCVEAVAPREAEPAATLVARFAFDGDLSDTSASGLVLSASGDPAFTVDRTGHAAGALAFDGIDDALVAPTSAALAVGDGLSVAAWVRVDDVHDGLIAAYGAADTDHGSWSAAVREAQSWHLLVRQDDGTDLASVQPPYTETELAPGQWIHVAMTWSRAELVARIYVDGRPVTESPVADEALTYPAGASLFLGTWPGRSDSGYLHGALDDLRIYAGALSEVDLRTLIGNTAAHCGGCVAGTLFDGADCRPPVLCASRAADCAAQHRGCEGGTVSPTSDARCGACITPWEEADGSCALSPRTDCSEPDLVHIEAETAKHSTGAGYCGPDRCWDVWSNGWVYERIYIPSSGEYLARTRVRGGQAGPDPIRAGFRVDGVDLVTFSFAEPSGTWHLEDAAITLTAGWHDFGVSFLNDFNVAGVGDRNLFVDWFELRGAGVNVWSMRAMCDAQNRQCVDTELTTPTCADCGAGYAINPALGDECDELRSCVDIGCPALGRACSGEPFAVCGACLDGLASVDPANPMSRCIATLTCDDLICGDEFCIPSDTAGVDASCSAGPCGDGKARTSTGACVTCQGVCGVANGGNLGETGRWWPYTLGDGTCICENEPGWYTSSSGAGLPLECDADRDGWVSADAALTVDSNDAARRNNARCSLRQVDRVTLRNDLGQQLEVLLCGADGLVAAPLGECPSGAPTPVSLFEDVELDDASKRQADDPAFPSYRNGLAGRALATNELNPLTKACVTDRGDFNHNGIVDLSEAAGMTPPVGVTLGAMEAVMLQFSTFLELSRVFYQDRPGEDYGTLVIAERSRCDLGADGFPLGYAEASGSTYWRQCARNRPGDYDATAGRPGYDLQRWTCASASGSCPAPPPSTVVVPTTVAPTTGQCDIGAACGAACAFDPEPIRDDLMTTPWLFSGAATRNAAGGYVDLGPAAGVTHGAVFNGVEPVTLANARVSFDFQTDAGSGGMALTLYDAAHGDPTGLVDGALLAGAGLGYAQAPGSVQALTVEIDVADADPGDPAAAGAVGAGSHIAIMLDGDSQHHGDRWVDAAPFIDGAWHRMELLVWGTWVQISIDGAPILGRRIPRLDFEAGYVVLSNAFTGAATSPLRRVRNLDVDEGWWRGMGHASQFRCSQAKAAAPGLAPWQTPLTALYDAATGKSGDYQFNACGAAGVEPNATPVANPGHPELTCTQLLPQDAQVGFVARRYDDGKGPASYDGGCIDEWLTWPELCPGYLGAPSRAQGTTGDGIFNEFGHLACGCGVDYGGPDCQLGCASPAYGDSDGGASVAETYGIAPRTGYWMCGAISSSYTTGLGAGAEPLLQGTGADGTWTIDGQVRIAPRDRTPLCEDPAHCASGWRLR